jgi:hypothetical protein
LLTCITLVHGLQIDLNESIGHIEPKKWVIMKALLAGQLFWLFKKNQMAEFNILADCYATLRNFMEKFDQKNLTKKKFDQKK